MEISLLSKIPSSQLKTEWRNQDTSQLKGIFLWREKEEMHQRIKMRTKEILEMGGIEEIKNIDSFSRSCLRTIGIKSILSYLKGEKEREEIQEEIIFRTKQYTKRQTTWFKREKWAKKYKAEEFSSILKQVQCFFEITSL